MAMFFTSCTQSRSELIFVPEFYGENVEEVILGKYLLTKTNESDYLITDFMGNILCDLGSWDKVEYNTGVFNCISQNGEYTAAYHIAGSWLPVKNTYRVAELFSGTKSLTPIMLEDGFYFKYVNIQKIPVGSDDGYGPVLTSASEFSEGFSVVRGKDQKLYLITEQFDEQILAIQNGIPDRAGFQNGVLRICTDDIYNATISSGCYITKNNTLLTTEYEGKTIKYFELCQNFSEGLAAVKIDGLWGYIDTNGALVISPEYLCASSFSKGNAGVTFSDGSFGTIDTNGMLINGPFKENEFSGEYYDGYFL